MRGSLLFASLAILGALPLGSRLLKETKSANVRLETSDKTQHPLEPVLALARETHAYALGNVRGFSCRLVKRERISGELQQERIVNLVVREGNHDGQKYATRLDFLTPDDVAGRTVLFVEGEHDDRMLARKGGRRLNFVVLRLDPHGFKAQGETLASITQLSFARSLATMIKSLEQQIEADPNAANTVVEWDDAANLDGRTCRLVRVIHPERDDALAFHRAEVFLDNQHGLPLRIALHDWPLDAGDPPLIAEYSYGDLTVCDSLPPETFDLACLHQE